MSKVVAKPTRPPTIVPLSDLPEIVPPVTLTLLASVPSPRVSLPEETKEPTIPPMPPFFESVEESVMVIYCPFTDCVCVILVIVTDAPPTTAPRIPPTPPATSLTVKVALSSAEAAASVVAACESPPEPGAVVPLVEQYLTVTVPLATLIPPITPPKP